MATDLVCRVHGTALIEKEVPVFYGMPTADSGIFRSLGDDYIDYSGVLRSPGEDFIDNSGTLRSPDEGFIDGNGIYRGG